MYSVEKMNTLQTSFLEFLEFLEFLDLGDLWTKVIAGMILSLGLHLDAQLTEWITRGQSCSPYDSVYLSLEWDLWADFIEISVFRNAYVLMD